jgi:hypothetical protein
MVACAGDRESQGDRGSLPEVVKLAEASSRYPDQTASDWVTYADHVVVATPIDERVIESSQEDLDGPPSMISRELSLRVDSMIWTRPGVKHDLPDIFEWPALGWMANEDGSRGEKLATRGSPRVEVGHTYVFALRWEPSRCPDGDAVVPARWVGLGSDAVVPYDDHELGTGELEGNDVYFGITRDSLAGKPVTLEQELLGLRATALAQRLRAATAVTPDPEETANPAPCRSR